MRSAHPANVRFIGPTLDMAGDAIVFAGTPALVEFAERHGEKPHDVRWIRFELQAELPHRLVFGIYLRDHEGRYYVNEAGTGAAMTERRHDLIGLPPAFWIPVSSGVFIDHAVQIEEMVQA